MSSICLLVWPGRRFVSRLFIASSLPSSLCVRKAGINLSLDSSPCSFVELVPLLTTAAVGSLSWLAAGEQLLARLLPPRSRRNGDIRGKLGDLLSLGAAASSVARCTVVFVGLRSIEVSMAGGFGLRRSLCIGILSIFWESIECLGRIWVDGEQRSFLAI